MSYLSELQLTMSRCYAFKKDFSPCRNFGEVAEETDTCVTYSSTCYKHREFFDNWSKKLLRIGCWIERYPGYRYNHVKRILEDGIAEVKEEDIKKLSGTHNYTHLILLCAKYVDGFKRSWNPSAFDRAVKNIWWQIFAVGPVYVSSMDLVCMLKCYDEPIVDSFYKVLPMFPNNGYQEPLEDQWFRVIDVLLENTWLKWDPDLLKPEHITKLKEKSNYLPRLKTLVENGSLQAKLKSAKQNFYANQKELLDPVKEELIAYTWHPDRFMEWCLDWEEKKWVMTEF
jgi:hypothetical protein